MGTAYTDTFDAITDKKTYFPRFFVHHQLHSEIQVSALKYGEHNIMSTLQSLNTWLTFNKFSTHHDASIGFLKYTSTDLTLQYINKKRVTSARMKVDFFDEDIIALQQTTENEMTNTQTNKRKPDGHLKDITCSQQRIVIPDFDLSTKRIGFGNGSNRVTTIAYEIKCHPTHSTLLKSLLIKSSVLDPLQPSNSNIHFIPHGLIQSTDATTVKTQIT